MATPLKPQWTWGMVYEAVSDINGREVADETPIAVLKYAAYYLNLNEYSVTEASDVPVAFIADIVKVTLETKEDLGDEMPVHNPLNDLGD
jgi:hypothetical protein